MRGRGRGRRGRGGGRSRGGRPRKPTDSNHSRGGGRGGGRPRKPTDSPNFLPELPRGWKSKGGTGPKFGEYELCYHIADGTFGRVFEVQDDGKQRWAMKIMQEKAQHVQYDSSATREAEILKSLYEADPGGVSGMLAFKGTVPVVDSRGQHYSGLIMERLACSAFDFVKANRRNGLQIRVVQTGAGQLLQALAFLHGRGITHTDIKHKNVSGEHYVIRDSSRFPAHVDERLEVYKHPKHIQVKLLDYGNAERKGVDPHPNPIHTKQFRAPEILLKTQPWDQTSDLWCLGQTLFFMFTGALMANSHEPGDILALLERGIGPLPPSMRKRKLPSRRSTKPLSGPTLEDVKGHHPQLESLLRGLLAFEPAKRKSAKQLFQHAFFKERFPGLDTTGCAVANDLST